MKQLKLKPDWIKYLHKLRLKELEIIKPFLQTGFDEAIEIGAGDGFQSQILAKHCLKLYCTEINELRIKKLPNPNIEYMICDAETINDFFAEYSIDLVFSSNLLEHLSNPAAALKGIKKILKNEGLNIHIIPNPFFTFTIFLFHYPNFFLMKLEKLINLLFIRNRKEMGERISFENNIKVTKKFNKMYNILKLPKPHGVSESFFQELKLFSKKRWINLFEKEEFIILDLLKGPVYSGYGFGLNGFRKILETLGFCSEYIYITKNK